jgi:hypothetical protein
MIIPETGDFVEAVPMDHYTLTGGAFVLRCIDDRFSRMLNNYMRARGWEHKDSMPVPGGARVLASMAPEDANEKASVLKWIKLCIKLHAKDPNGVVIFLETHVDCGGYGSSSAFASPEAEMNRLRLDLQAAASFLRNDPEIPPGIIIEAGIGHAGGLKRISLT